MCSILTCFDDTLIIDAAIEGTVFKIPARFYMLKNNALYDCKHFIVLTKQWRRLNLHFGFEAMTSKGKGRHVDEEVIF